MDIKIMKDLILKSRFTLLLTTLAAYTLVVVVEGAVTDREPDLLHFDNSMFELDVRELNEFVEVGILDD